MEFRQLEFTTDLELEERQAEAARLGHGLACLDLFEKEVKEEDERQRFVSLTAPGSDTRQNILAGPSYAGDETKLEAARSKAYSRYGINNIKRQAMYHHALYLGIEAKIDRSRVITVNPEDQERLSVEHGKWRAAFASKQREQERNDQRDYIEGRIRRLLGTQETEGPIVKAVNIEDRAVLLTRALNILAHRSMLSGMNVAVVDPSYKIGIYDRYKDDTPFVKSASLRKFTRLYLEAQRNFWDANNFSEFVRSGVYEETLLRQLIQHWWDVFTALYEFSPNHDRLDAARNAYKKYIPASRMHETEFE
ncbi:MAG TPA: hypothetical protein VFN31_02950 [Candidatus Saccharimonadales bacterium]|nr:hypothetical protein [Candidatus Saccharimonadales bacterium]